MASSKLKKILFFFDSRATFAYSNNVIKIFKKKKKKFDILVSGNYLEKKMKIDKNLFKENKLKIFAKVKFKSPSNQLSSWPISFGKAMIKYADVLSKSKPEMIVLTGDRIETLSMCITCAYMNIPIAHIQAGDKSGHIDDISRAAIAKFSNVHFAPSKEAFDRLLEWGEDKKRIFLTGAPQLDDIKLIYQPKKNYFVLIYHPILNEQKYIKNQILNILKAVDKTKIKVYWIYPNNDMGFTNILKKINKTKNKNITIIPNLERKSFLKLLSQSKGMIGNSSAGIIEASLYKIPVINIGNRQEGRPQSKNIVNCRPNTKDIIKKIRFISDNKKFITSLKKTKNPFYVKNSSEKIYRVLMNLRKKNDLLSKY
jgi:GDP/UDP-N,N'-diacetylbacillosamine 2-epimerase (hydrolysing)